MTPSTYHKPPKPKGMSDEIYIELLKEQAMLDETLGKHIPLADFDDDSEFEQNSNDWNP